MQTQNAIIDEVKRAGQTSMEAERGFFCTRMRRIGMSVEPQDILSSIREQQAMSSQKLENFFWSMFVGDGLLGNFDRHNGNWGFLVNEEKGVIKLAPVYDCGSCLYPQLDERGMEAVLSSPNEMDERIYVFPNSAIKEKGRKINYFKFFAETEVPECLAALKQVGGRIDLEKISSMIDAVPYISTLHKTFLKTMIRERKEKIIDRAMERFT